MKTNDVHDPIALAIELRLKELGEPIYSYDTPETKKEKLARNLKNSCILWIERWFDINGYSVEYSDFCKAVVGISGGKDSTIVAALCCEALGNDNVIGVLMPNGEQADIEDSRSVVKHLGIKSYEVNIKDSVEAVLKSLPEEIAISEQTKLNLPPRIRMATLYAISQSVNGRVANTCNLSENYVGYSTRFGDEAGDFSPLGNLTVTEVKMIGYELGLPKEFIEKTPSDGLCGESDEEKLGFSYDELDLYIRGDGKAYDVPHCGWIKERHEKNFFKMQPIATFDPGLKIVEK